MSKIVKLNQGQHAVRSGSALEQALQHEFASYGVTCVMHSEYQEESDLLGPVHPPKILLRRAPFTCLFGRDSTSYADYLYRRPFFEPVYWECKQQDGSGSADSKLHFTFKDALQAPQIINFALVLEGEGFRWQAVEWLKDEFLKVKHKRFILLTSHAEMRAAVRALVEDNKF